MKWRTRPSLFTDKDTGCHAGSKRGRDNMRETLAKLVERVGGDATALRAPATDDAHEEQEALALLQTFTAAGLLWRIERGGDLFLTEDPDRPPRRSWTRRLVSR